MFQNFILRTAPVLVGGYHWPVENPKAVICLIHGIGEHAARHDERPCEAFVKNGIAVLSMDLRGHGISAGSRGDAAPRREILSDVDMLLQYAAKQYPGKRIILFGHSMGGNIALDYRFRGALSDMPDGYIATSPWIKLNRQYTALRMATLARLAKIAPKTKLSTGIADGSPENAMPDGDWKNDMLIHKFISARCAYDGFEIGSELLAGTLAGNHLGRSKPLLMMQGTADTICSLEGSRAFAAYEPNCTYIEWDGVGHNLRYAAGTFNADDIINRMVEFTLTLQ